MRANFKEIVSQAGMRYDEYDNNFFDKKEFKGEYKFD